LSAALFLTAGIRSSTAIRAKVGRQPAFYSPAPGLAPAPAPFPAGPGFAGVPGFGPLAGAPGAAYGTGGTPGVGAGGAAAGGGRRRTGGSQPKVPGGLQPDSQHSMAATALTVAGLNINDLDKNPKDGVITLNETATWAAVAAIPFFEVKRVFAMNDKNSDGRLTADELSGGQFSSAWHTLKSSFSALDADIDGFISKREWDSYCMGWMFPRPSRTACRELFTGADVEKPKGMLSRNEFEKGGRTCKSPTDGSCSLLQAAMQQAMTMQHSNRQEGSKMGFLQQLGVLEQRYSGMHQ